jgi:hypothetical protein
VIDLAYHPTVCGRLRLRRLHVQGPPRQKKVCETSLLREPSCHFNNGRQYKIGELWSRPALAKTEALSQKYQCKKGLRSSSYGKSDYLARANP